MCDIAEWPNKIHKKNVGKMWKNFHWKIVLRNFICVPAYSHAVWLSIINSNWNKKNSLLFLNRKFFEIEIQKLTERIAKMNIFLRMYAWKKIQFYALLNLKAFVILHEYFLFFVFNIFRPSFFFVEKILLNICFIVFVKKGKSTLILDLYSGMLRV